jgi:hypothetical protein
MVASGRRDPLVHVFDADVDEFGLGLVWDPGRDFQKSRSKLESVIDRCSAVACGDLHRGFRMELLSLLELPAG